MSIFTRYKWVFSELQLPKNIVAHSKKVARIAKNLAKAIAKKGRKVDIELVETGALLHDVGRARTHGLSHGVIGGKILREMGFDDKVVRIVERHVVSGLTANEAKRMGLPARSYLPKTIEEKIVCYADKVSDEGKIKRIIEKCGDRSGIAKRLKLLFEEIDRLRTEET